MTPKRPRAGEHESIFGPDWIQSITEAPATAYVGFYRQVLEATSRCLETQAEFARQLSECKTPAEALACQREFTQKFVALGIKETNAAFGALQVNMPIHTKHPG